jgi:hypothetical protein
MRRRGDAWQRLSALERLAYQKNVFTDDSLAGAPEGAGWFLKDHFRPEPEAPEGFFDENHHTRHDQ